MKGSIIGGYGIKAEFWECVVEYRYGLGSGVD
jgi:hypothetical protein